MYVSCGGGVGEVSRGFVTEGDACDKGHVLFTKSSCVLLYYSSWVLHAR